ncbi:glycosyltransferase family 2 protein [Macrococcus lamae]|uniref:Glycosyltransferase family 2 protein n=1 Tax=Macrococcus lamae TaxID=198484 RepID=A0A4R6BW46_9STAP|nr:glycosyltransferase family 2 protein [Macrococcus lamae]TDM12407.1 glycosyltransferase family 2 protein [Macrococcus lamae]
MISIVIPIFNAEKTIINTLNSIQATSTELIEIICIDDGSTDGSRQLIEDWLKDTIYKTVVVEQENKGAAAARNYGIKLSTYPYILFLDSDDQLTQHGLQHFIELLNQYPGFDVYVGQMLHLRGQKTSTISTHTLRNGPTTLNEQPALLQSIGPSAKLYDKRVITQLFDEDITFCEEHTFNVSAYSRNVFVSLEPVYLYNIDTGASVTQNLTKTDLYLSDALIVRQRVWQQMDRPSVWNYYSYRMDELIVSYLIKRTLSANISVDMMLVIKYLDHMVTTAYFDKALSKIVNFIMIYGSKHDRKIIGNWCEINQKEFLIPTTSVLYLRQLNAHLKEWFKRLIN